MFYHTVLSCICQTILMSLYLTFSNYSTLHLISASLISIFVMQFIASYSVRSLFCRFFEFISRICARSLIRNTLNLCLARSSLEISHFASALHLESLFLSSQIIFKVRLNHLEAKISFLFLVSFYSSYTAHWKSDN